MPGKHAPSSPASFYLSLGRWGALAAGVVGVLVAIVLVVTGGGDTTPTLAGSRKPTAKASRAPQVDPTSSSVPSAAPLRDPSATKVRVLNGTHRTGLAGRVGDELAKEGYKVLERTNGPVPTSVTTIYYKAGWLAEARAMRRAHPEFSKLLEAPEQYAKKAALTVLLGNDYP